MLYIIILAVVVQQFVAFKPDPVTFSPPYWIMMGASAITTLAGSQLALAGAGAPPLAHLRPFVEGLAVMFWATATWWIPLLLLLGLWRHVWHRVAPRYDPQFWAMVFPLGMYTACTLQLARVTGAPLLLAIPQVMIYIALGAWLLTLLGMAAALGRQLPALLAKRLARTEGG
jgi:tellurite resistance protein TehA-like permease